MISFLELLTQDSMKYFCIFSALVFLFCSCSQSRHENIVFEINNNKKPALNKKLISELSGYINYSKTTLEHEGKDTLKCYIVEFDKYNDDSVVRFSENISGLIDFRGYMGILKLDTYEIVIIDKYNIGSFFYNKDSLLFVDTNILQKVYANTRFVTQLIIREQSIVSKYDWKNINLVEY